MVQNKHAHKDISGVILAGGKSRRMGIPKPFLSLHGKTLIDTVIDRLNLFEEIVIVTNDKRPFFENKTVIVVEDLIPDLGPLGGIYTGLKTISNRKALFVACDMPFLNRDLIERLVERSKEDDYDCVVPYSNRGIEPLHAIYSKNILPLFDKCMSRNELAIRQLIRHGRCLFMETTKEEQESFLNINTPKDLECL